MSKTVTFPSYDSFKYCEVFLVTERRQGMVYRTKRLGFCSVDHPKQKDEIYTPLSTSMTKPGTTITLELME